MLEFIRDYTPSQAVSMAESSIKATGNYARDHKEDVQKAIEYIFDLDEKLKKLHPLAYTVAMRMLKIGY